MQEDYIWWINGSTIAWALLSTSAALEESGLLSKTDMTYHSGWLGLNNSQLDQVYAHYAKNDADNLNM